MKETSINLMINGREEKFDEKQLIDILKEHFDEDTIKIKMPKNATGIECHKVLPGDIDKTLFKAKRENKVEEAARKIILDAIHNYLDVYPEKYGKPFKTIVFIGKFEEMTLIDVEEFAKEYGSCIGNIVDLALEWAYRISMGESWESVCNNIYRGFYKLVQYECRYFFLFNGAEKKSVINTVGWSSDDYAREKIKEKFTPVIKINL